MEELRPEPVATGVASRTLAGQSVCGDQHVFAPFPGGYLVAVIDGLGHGREAAEAADAAVKSIVSHAGQPLTDILQTSHRDMSRTRGAVMAIACFNFNEKTLTWISVGNVEGYLLRTDNQSKEQPCVLTRGGIVGQSLPSLRTETLKINPGDTLIMGTDGMRSGFTREANVNALPQETADKIMDKFFKGSDDALVAVAKWTGTA